jgi:hypothetical protein
MPTASAPSSAQHADLGRRLELRAQHPGVHALVQLDAGFGRGGGGLVAQGRVVGLGHVDEAAGAGFADAAASAAHVQVVG